jgi:hypothetical protein
MALKPIKSRRSWENLTINSNPLAAGCSVCNDIYEETNNLNAYYHPGPSVSQSVFLNIYSAENDSSSGSASTAGTISNSLTESAGMSVCFTSKSHFGGASVYYSYGGTTTTLITNSNIVTDISGSMIRIIGGDNAGYEGIITSNTIGTNSVLTVSPSFQIGDAFSAFEVFAGSVYMMYATTTNSTSFTFSVYDIATNSWFSRSNGIMSQFLQYPTKLTSLPHLNSIVDVGTVSVVQENLLPSGSDFTVGGWLSDAGTLVEVSNLLAPPGKWAGDPSTMVTYSNGAGYVGTTGYFFKPFTEYTYSIYVYSGAPTPITLSVDWGTSATQQIVPSASWVRYTFTFTTTYVSNSQNKIGFIAASTFFVYGGQLEVGNTASTYIDSTYAARSGSINLITSGSSPASWLTNFGATVATGYTDPFGGTLAALCTDGTSNAPTIIFPSFTQNFLNKQICFSVYLKADTTSVVQIQMEGSSSPYTAITSASLNITGSWVRYSLTGLGINFSATTCFIRIGTTLGINEGSVYVAFPQLEYGSVPTPYVHTTGNVVAVQEKTGTSIVKVSLTGKNYLPGSLVNYRARFTVPSKFNLLAFSETFSNNSVWTNAGGSTKSGNTLLCASDAMRCDVRPQLLAGYLKEGSTTFSIVASGTGTFTIYAWNVVSSSTSPQQRYTLSSTPTRFVYTYNFPTPFGFPVFGRSVGDTATAITVHSGQLEYGTSATTYMPNNGLQIGYSGGTVYVPIISNDDSSITIQGSIDTVPLVGSTIYIEPNGDDIYLSGNNATPLYLYNQRSNTWLNSEIIQNGYRGSAPGYEHSACFINKIDGWNLSTNVPKITLSTPYTFGDKIRHSGSSRAYDFNTPSVYECNIPGTSGSSSVAGGLYLTGIASTLSDGAATFISRFTEQPGRYIYSFKGSVSGILHIYDIPTSRWYSSDTSLAFKYGGQGVTINSGTSYAQNGNYIYFGIPISYGQTNFYRFDVKKNLMEPFVSRKSSAINNSITTGSRMWVSTKTIGNEKIRFVYTGGSTNSTGIPSASLYRAREITN